MAAKRTTLNGSVLQETVGIALNIHRFPIPGEPPAVGYAINFSYGDHTYLVGANGDRTKLLLQGENQKGVNLSPDRVGYFLSYPITEEMVGKPLGDILADLWDVEIQRDMAAQQ